MSAGLDRQEAPTEDRASDRAWIPAGRAFAGRRWFVPGVFLVAGLVLGMAAALGVGALVQSGSTRRSLSGAAAEIPSLAQPQHREDALPTNVPGLDTALIADGSSRLVGQTGTASYYLTRSTAGEACLLILPADPSHPWVQGCSGHLPFSVVAVDSSARVIPSDGATPAGTIRMGLNVVVDPTSRSLMN